jgi:hypothetical protein
MVRKKNYMAQRKVLIVGGGSKFGESLADLYSSDYEVHVITGSDSDMDRVIKVDWNHCKIDDVIPYIDDDYDVVVFNQNGGGAPNGVEGEHAYFDYVQPQEWWNQAFFNNVQLSYYIVKKLRLSLGMKICWMLSPMFHHDYREFGQPYGGYGGDKAYNMHIMKTFSFYNDASFYGLVPRHFDGSDQFALQIYKVIQNLDLHLSGQLIDEKGDIWTD